jgi:hypothetical protein
MPGATRQTEMPFAGNTGPRMFRSNRKRDGLANGSSHLPANKIGWVIDYGAGATTGTVRVASVPFEVVLPCCCRKNCIPLVTVSPVGCSASYRP